jgi:Icc-related predicted phosphoesterase
MTILHVTDFHFNKRWFDWLPDRAPAHDLLVMSGDMLSLSDVVSHPKQIDWVSDWIGDYPHPLCVCSGNHDLEWNMTTELWTPAYWLRDLASAKVWVDGQRLTLDDISLRSIGCTTHPKGGAADIWVVHAPPAQTRVALRANGRDDGDRDLVSAVRRHAPRVILSGHVHHPMHWFDQKDGTLHLNPGRTADAAFPNHILLSTEDMRCQLITAKQHEILPAMNAIGASTAADCLASATA